MVTREGSPANDGRWQAFVYKKIEMVLRDGDKRIAARMRMVEWADSRNRVATPRPGSKTKYPMAMRSKLFGSRAYGRGRGMNTHDTHVSFQRLTLD